MHILAVGNTRYGKRHTSRTVSSTPLQSILEESLHLRQYFFNSTHSSTRKTPQRRTLHITLRQLEKRTSSRATDRCHLTMNFGDNANQSHSNRYQPLTDRKERATQRSFTRRMTKIQAQLKRDSNPTRRTFSWSTCTAAQKYWDQCKLSSKISQVWFGKLVFRKARFLLYWKQYCCRKTNFTRKKYAEKSWIIVWRARPLRSFG